VLYRRLFTCPGYNPLALFLFYPYDKELVIQVYSARVAMTA
jgi:hypothetical protein